MQTQRSTDAATRLQVAGRPANGGGRGSGCCSGDEDALDLEQLVVRVSAHAVRTGVLDGDLAELPDRLVARLNDPRRERVGSGVDAAGTPNGRARRRQAIERDREAEVQHGGGVRL